MVKVAKVFSLFEMDSILRKAGAERVSEKASQKLSEVLEDSAKQLLEKARLLARHAGRSRVTRKDVLLAARLLKKENKYHENHADSFAGSLSKVG